MACAFKISLLDHKECLISGVFRGLRARIQDRAEIIPVHMYSRDDLSNKRKSRNGTTLKPRQKRSGNERSTWGYSHIKRLWREFRDRVTWGGG